MFRFTLDLTAKAGARIGSVPKNRKIEFFFGGGTVNDPLSEKIRNSVPKEFMTTPIHILCSNFI